MSLNVFARLVPPNASITLNPRIKDRTVSPFDWVISKPAYIYSPHASLIALATQALKAAQLPTFALTKSTLFVHSANKNSSTGRIVISHYWRASLSSVEMQKVSERVWDVVVVGTGMGGATAGYALAKQGLDVLFVEKGLDHSRNSESLVGDWAEAFLYAPGNREPMGSLLKRAGRWTETVARRNDSAMVPMLGQGPGGSSALYGMVLERMYPRDFEPGSFIGDAGSSAPRRWPIGMGDLAPYYKAAEELYRVRSTIDPLRPGGEDRSVLAPPPFSPPNAGLASHLSDRGYHPYHLPMSCDYVPGCRECIGFLCDKRCKVDSGRACLEPALQQYRATLLADCAVEALETEGNSVTSLRCRWRNDPLTLRGRIVILAAGALQTPALLMKSASERRPNGLANSSGQVGRNLMRHMLDYYLLEMPAPIARGTLVKQLAFNDFYFANGEKLGTVQSNGILPPVRSLAYTYLDDLADRSGISPRIIRLARPMVERRLRQILPRSLVLASLLEDFPYADNRVQLAPDGSIVVSYEVKPDDRRRLTLFRKLVADALKPFKVTAIHSGEKTRALGHACGTCRFGDDPAANVLNRDNRTHDIDNLYVVDTSFMPTSSGTNPSLTVAANALRVADHIVARQREAFAQTLPGSS